VFPQRRKLVHPRRRGGISCGGGANARQLLPTFPRVPPAPPAHQAISIQASIRQAIVSAGYRDVAMSKAPPISDRRMPARISSLTSSITSYGAFWEATIRRHYKTRG